MPGSLTMLGAGRRSSAPAWLLSAGGTRASLDIDFVNDLAYNGSLVSIASLLSCSRASTGYYTKADGTLQSFSSNTLRYGTNGLLVEEARTNIVSRSEEFDNATWTKTATYSSVSANATTAPDGTSTADKFQAADTTAANRQCFQIGLSLSAAAYTASAYVKDAGNGWVILNLYDGSNHLAWFQLSGAGTVGTVQAGNTATITALASGWYRITVTRTAASTANGGMSIELTTADNVTAVAGVVGNGTYVWGAQLEAGSFATSYIPTTSSSATRAADAITSVSSWLTPGIGTVLADFNLLGGGYNAVGGNWNTAIAHEIAASPSNNMAGLGVGSSTTTKAVLRNGGSYQANISPTVTLSGNIKGALAYSTNDIQAAFNGASSGAAVTTATIPAFDQIRVGYNAWFSAYLNGNIRRLSYWGSRLAISDMQSLTT